MKRNNDYKPGCFTRSIFYIFCLFAIYYLFKLVVEYPQVAIISTVVVLLISFNILNDKNRKRRHHFHYHNLYDTLKDLDKDEEVDEEDNVIINSAEELKKYHNDAKVVTNTKNEDKIPLVKENPNYRLPKLSSYIKDEKIKSIFNSHRYDAIFLMKKDYGYERIDIKSKASLLIYSMYTSDTAAMLHNIIFGILLCKKPYEYQIIIVDSSRLEFIEYNGIPHLMCPVVTNWTKSYITLENIGNEIDYRINILSKYNCRDIWTYNNKIYKKRIKNEKLPNILLIINSSDLLLENDKRRFSDSVIKILKKGRNVGINLVCSINKLNKSIYNYK